MLLIKMNFFVTVRKKIKEMMNVSPLKGVGLWFIFLGVLEISLVQFCWWMGEADGLGVSRSGSQILFSIIAVICELFYVRQIGIIKCSIGALLLIIHMVKKNMHTENNLGRKQ